MISMLLLDTDMVPINLAEKHMLRTCMVELKIQRNHDHDSTLIWTQSIPCIT